MAVEGPWHIDISPYISWARKSGAGPNRTTVNSALGGARIHMTDSFLGEYIEWDVNLTAGTWTITIIHIGDTAACDTAAKVKLNGTLVGTVNLAASSANNLVATVSGIAVASDGVVPLRMEIGTNGKYHFLQHITLMRTA